MERLSRKTVSYIDTVIQIKRRVLRLFRRKLVRAGRKHERYSPMHPLWITYPFKG